MNAHDIIIKPVLTEKSSRSHSEQDLRLHRC